MFGFVEDQTTFSEQEMYERSDKAQDYHLMMSQIFKEFKEIQDAGGIVLPAKNPDLWNTNLMKEVGEHTAKHGTISTFTAAGFVRENLKTAGFEVKRIDGYGRKRHMTVGTLKDDYAA